MDEITDPCSWLSDPKAALAAYSLMILREGRMGRKGLAEALGVGEATGRTILSKLKAAGLAASDRGGAYLTPAGEEKSESLLRLVRPIRVELPERYGNAVVGVEVKAACDLLRTGVRQRDEAVRGGALGALVLIKRGGKYVFPEDGQEYPLVASPEPADGSCVIVAWADSTSQAIHGAMRAAGSMACGARRGPGRPAAARVPTGEL